MSRRVCVLGAGIVGLSSAVYIQELVPDADVTVVADTFTPNTLSDGCAGLWMPYLVDASDSDVLRWSGETFDYLKGLGHSEIAGDIGVQFVSGYYFVRQSAYTGKEPPWKDQVLGFRKLTSEELRISPNARDGYFFTTLILDVKRYLPWLTKRYIIGNITPGITITVVLSTLGLFDNKTESILGEKKNLSNLTKHTKTSIEVYREQRKTYS